MKSPRGRLLKNRRIQIQRPNPLPTRGQQSAKMTKLARDQHVKALLLADQGSLSGKDFIQSLGLPKPLPQKIERFVQIHDELKLQIQCRPMAPYFSQWNFMSSQWAFDTSALKNFRTQGNYRFLPSLYEFKGKAIYHLVHETAHGIFSEIGFRGLFRHLLDSSQEPWTYFVLGEMFAEFASNYELPLQMNSYWKKHWAPFAERPPGQQVDAGSAAVRAGLTTAKKRADLHLQSYFSKTENLGKKEIQKLLRHPELMSMWFSVRAYSIQSWKISHLWWARFWSHEALKIFIHDFIPQEPALVWTEKKSRPLKITNLNQFASQYENILNDWVFSPPEQKSFFQVRKKIQQTALTVSQFFPLIDYEGLLISSAKRSAMRKCLEKTYAELQFQFDQLQSLSERKLTKKEAQQLEKKISRLLPKLTRDLMSLAQSQTLSMIHPGIFGADLFDGQLDLRILEKKKKRLGLKEQEALLARISLVLTTLKEDLLAMSSFDLKSNEFRKEIQSMTLFSAEAELRSRGSYSHRENDLFLTQISTWYLKMLRKNRILKFYRIDWISDMSFIDPLIGFRFK